MAVVSETTHRVVCDECGYHFDEADTRSKARELAERDEHRRLVVVDGRDLCFDCTDEGRASIREHLIRLATNSWKYDGVDPEVSRRVAGAMLDQGIMPPAETPIEALRANVGNDMATDEGGVIALVFRDCEECGVAVACLHGSDGGPKSCSQHG